MNAAIVRIVLRYAAGALMAKGIIGLEAGSMLASDKDILYIAEILLAVGISTGSEIWYYLAKKYGWAK